MKLGRYLGYSNIPCPNCGRVRLENFDNGIQVCEKCGWCPQEEAYIDSNVIFENDYENTYGLL